MRERRDYGPYARRMADLMGLRDWTIRVAPDDPPEGEDDVADVLRIKGRRLATIRLSDAFLASPEDEQRDTITHELIHCQGAFVDTFLIDRLNRGDRQAFSTLREYEVDSQAAVFAPLLPLPSDVLGTDAV